MKQLTKLTTLLMLLLVGVGFTACSDDDDNNSSSSNPNSSTSIVGTWRCDYGAGGYTTYTFKSDGTGYFYTVEYYEGNTYDEGYAFTYTLRNNILTMTCTEGDETETDSGPVTISGNKMTWDGDTYVRV